MNMCQILNGYLDEAVSICLISSPNCFRFLFFGWMKSEVYKRKVDTPDGSLARILDVVATIKKREDQLRRTTRDLHTRVEKCVEVGGGIWGHLL